MHLTPTQASEFERLLRSDKRRLDQFVALYRRVRLATGEFPELADRVERECRYVSAPWVVLDALEQLSPAFEGAQDQEARAAQLLEDGLPGLGVTFNRVLSMERDLHAEVDRLRKARPGKGHRPSFDALFATPIGAGRRAALLSLIGHLVSSGVAPGVVLGVAEAFDYARCRPPLGPESVGELVRWVATRELEKAA